MYIYIIFHSLNPKQTDKIILARYEGGYRGIFARNDIAENEVLVRSGSSSLIDEHDALKRYSQKYFGDLFPTVISAL